MVVASSGHSISPPYSQDVLAFAKAYGDNMVLQSAPKASQVWGWSPTSVPVRVTVTDSTGKQIFGGDAPVAAGKWQIMLPPINASFTAYTISATAKTNVTTLTNVVFGEVWVCGGQSNMEYTVGGFAASPGSQDAVTNATAEIAAAANFPLIRVMTVGKQCSQYSAVGKNTASVVSAARAASTTTYCCPLLTYCCPLLGPIHQVSCTSRPHQWTI
jgi:sialate O-acetylesterase